MPWNLLPVSLRRNKGMSKLQGILPFIVVHIFQEDFAMPGPSYSQMVHASTREVPKQEQELVMHSDRTALCKALVALQMFSIHIICGRIKKLSSGQLCPVSESRLNQERKLESRTVAEVGGKQPRGSLQRTQIML